MAVVHPFVPRERGDAAPELGRRPTAGSAEIHILPCIRREPIAARPQAGAKGEVLRREA